MKLYLDLFSKHCLSLMFYPQNRSFSHLETLTRTFTLTRWRNVGVWTTEALPLFTLESSWREAAHRQVMLLPGKIWCWLLACSCRTQFVLHACYAHCASDHESNGIRQHWRPFLSFADGLFWYDWGSGLPSITPTGNITTFVGVVEINTSAVFTQRRWGTLVVLFGNCHFQVE